MNEPIIDNSTGKSICACTGCGHLNIDSIGYAFLSCCPDFKYIPIRDYLHLLHKESLSLKYKVLHYKTLYES